MRHSMCELTAAFELLAVQSPKHYPNSMKSPKKNPGKSRRYARSILAVASVAATTGLLAQAAPAAKLAICLTPPPNSRQEAFEANYQDRYTRWGWKRIQHRLVERQLEHFAEDTQRNLSLIPTQVNIDPIDGYPADNAVHPNQSGYQQIGTSIYAWLKSQL